MTDGIEVEGLDHFRATTARAAARLNDLTDTQRKAGQLVLDRADVPRDSGDLAASGQVLEDGTVAWGEIYAPVIHYGWPDRNIEAQPFATDSLAENTDNVLDLFVDEINTITHTIEGR